MIRTSASALSALALLTAGCGATEDVILPGPDAARQLTERVAQARAGDVITLGEGTFYLTRTLTLKGSGVTLRGKGMRRTILSFRGQPAAAAGEEAPAGIFGKGTDGLLIEDLGVADTRGDGIKITNARGVTFRRVRVTWTRGPHRDNGEYGLYPVQSRDVLIDRCEVSGASDAGIYVGQSQNVVIRDSRAERNVAGIEVENCVGADVLDNTAVHNTAGVAVFNLPNLAFKGGRRVRVKGNLIHDNDTPSFAAPGEIVSLIPRGTGLLVLAIDQVEVTGNTLRSNQSANVAVVSYLVSGRTDYKKDAQYDPYPETVNIHDNTIYDGGTAPDPANRLGLAFITFAAGRTADIIWDGVANPAKLVSGKLPPALALCFQRNVGPAGKAATFLNFDGANLLQGKPRLSRDPRPHACTHKALPPVALPAHQR